MYSLRFQKFFNNSTTDLTNDILTLLKPTLKKVGSPDSEKAKEPYT